MQLKEMSERAKITMSESMDRAKGQAQEVKESIKMMLWS